MSNIKQSKVIHENDAKGLCLKLYKARSKGLVQFKGENNVFLMGCFKGVEPKIAATWNVKIFYYSDKKRGCSVVCNDWDILDKIVAEDWDYFTPPELPVISIDDAGWGFPLCGVMVGACDGKKVITNTVPVKFFQGSLFSSKQYLDVYSAIGIGLIHAFGYDVSPQTHRIEICTGFVNVQLKNDLRKMGFDVRVVEIKGLLQDELETHFKQYVKDTIGKDIYYDPKEMEKTDIPLEYSRCVEFGKKHYPHLLKTGWKSMECV